MVGRSLGQVAPESPTAAGEPAPGELTDRAQRLLQQAIFTLESRHSISAEISHQVDLFGKQLVGKGIYREERSGPYPLVRMELKMSLVEEMGTLVQVCDGQYLWTYEKLQGNGKLTRVDLSRVSKALEKTEGQGGLGNLSEVAAIGGLPRLLRGIEAAFRFHLAQQSTLHDLPVWKLYGRWRADQLIKILPEEKQAIGQGRGVDLSKLPKHLPDRVVLMLGQQDLFPYRIEYRRGRSPSGKPNDTSEGKPIVTLQLLKVSLNVPIDPACFVYRPGSVQISDRTESFVKRLAAGR